MAIPDYQSLMNPVLSLMADNKTRSVRGIVAELSLQHSWTDEELAEMFMAIGIYKSNSDVKLEYRSMMYWILK